ncbi:adenine deaminase [Leuconostocaceae bacterium ESL0723]|nr:adenine deaminase [Leuconostocaceae bacterium ESL0723]
MQTVDLHIENAQILDVFNQVFELGELWVDQGQIVSQESEPDWQAQTTIDAQGQYLVPGLIDAHVHIESSLLNPLEFGRLLLKNGVTTVFADPHEIASVAGLAGLEYMFKAAEQSPLNIYYMLPSSVPATDFERTGARLAAKDLQPLYQNPNVAGLAEVMDYPALQNPNSDLVQKIKDAQAAGKHVDGHLAGLDKKGLATYRNYQIETDHEASSAAEAKDRIHAGLRVFIREGTVERDEINLLPALNAANQGRLSFATDDKTASDLLHEGSINYNVALAIKAGVPAAQAYTLASFNAAQAHHLDQVGALAPGYQADFVFLDDLNQAQVQQVWVAGQAVSFQSQPGPAFENPPINFELNLADFNLPLKTDQKSHIIEIMPSHITTRHQQVQLKTVDGNFVPDANYAKILVAERYHNLGHGIGVIAGLKMRAGAIASTIAHDSHNLIVAGVNDQDMLMAANYLKEIGGGQVLVNQGQITALPLTIGGLMSTQTYETVVTQHQQLLQAYRAISDLDFDPFLTLSFMALPVIPSLKITDQGLFDFDHFQFINIQD